MTVIRDEWLNFVEEWGLFSEERGLPRIGGRILGLLLVTEGLLSAEKIASTLKVSLGSVSTNMKLLLTARLVEKKSIPGDRISYYVYATHAVENDILSHVKQLLVMKEISKRGLAIANEEELVFSRLKEIIKFIDLYIEMLKKLLEKES